MEKQLIYGKVAKVMAEIAPIAKGRKSESLSYKYRGVDELMNAVSPLVTKHGIFPTTSSIVDILYEPVTSKNGGGGTHIIRRYTFRFNAEDGSYVETTTDGEAIDYGDKASNKAYSVAYREAMFKMFVIPFENEDIEASEHDLNPAKPVTLVKKASPVKSTPLPESKEPTKPSNPPQPSKKEELARILQKRGIDVKDLKACQRYVADETGLELVDANLAEIIEILTF